tara:strand:+ start:2010 stop:2594 length:585 start_codon:yes stop_codon:yes gene_type:complete
VKSLQGMSNANKFDRELLLVALVFACFFMVGTEPLLGNDFGEGKPCGNRNTTICTIELWLSHEHKKENKVIRDLLKENSLKVIRKTIQYWRARGGHPPTNLAIGKAISAEDGRLAIDLAILLNDRVDQLVLQTLNPPNYVAIGTSAWDEKSLISITPGELQQLRDPKLNTTEFQRLYIDLTGESNRNFRRNPFY